LNQLLRFPPDSSCSFDSVFFNGPVPNPRHSSCDHRRPFRPCSRLPLRQFTHSAPTRQSPQHGDARELPGAHDQQ
jgi:hypothetical protein